MHLSSQTFCTFLTGFLHHRLRLLHRTQFRRRIFDRSVALVASCSSVSLPVGDEVKVTQKGDDGHSSAIINSALYSAHGGRNQLCAIISKIVVELAIQITCAVRSTR